MPVSSIASNSAASQLDTQKSFRDADFLKIMLKEVTSQSPFDPQDTSKLVENMTKLQDLANSNYTKYRNDLRWAQDLVGKEVGATQFLGTPDEVNALKQQGVNIDPGYGSITGTVTGFRVYNETVYLGINGKDYPIDNVKNVTPQTSSAQHLAEVGARLLGMQVSWIGSDAKLQTGVVSQVGLDSDGKVVVKAGNNSVNFDDIIRIGLNQQTP